MAGTDQALRHRRARGVEQQVARGRTRRHRPRRAPGRARPRRWRRRRPATAPPRRTPPGQPGHRPGRQPSGRAGERRTRRGRSTHQGTPGAVLLPAAPATALARAARPAPPACGRTRRPSRCGRGAAHHRRGGHRRCRCRASASPRRARPGLLRSGPPPTGRRWRRCPPARRRATRPASRLPSLAASGSSRQGRCGANRTRSPAASTKPAAATPTEHRPCRSVSATTTSTRASSTSMTLACSSPIPATRPGVGVVWVSSTRPLSSTTAARTLVPPMSTPMDDGHRRLARSATPIGAARVAELGQAHLEQRPVAADRHMALEAAPDRVEEQRPGLADPTADDDHVRVQHRGQRRDSLTDPVAQLREPFDRELVARAGRLGDHRTLDVVGLAPGELQDAARRGRVLERPLPGHAHAARCRSRRTRGSRGSRTRT